MMITRNGSHAVVADPDRDRIVAVDLATREVTFDLPLTQGDQPGRLIEDGAGRIHVALRGGGSLLTLNLAGETLDRRFACSEPRGLAWDQATENIYVACATGELVTFSALGGEAIRSIRLERDLRDVIIQGQNLVITKFRTAEVLTVAPDGAIINRISPPIVQRFGGFGGGFPSDAPTTGGGGGGLVNATAGVAWRAQALPDGRIVISHQRQVQDKLEEKQEGGYGTGCGGPVEAAITVISPTPGVAPVAVLPVAQGALPVDMAISKQGDKIAVITAGNKNVRVQQTSFALSSRDQNDCRPPDFPDDPEDMDDDDEDTDEDTDEDVDEGGAPTSAAFTPTGDLIVYYPEKPMLEIHRGGQQTLFPEQVVLPGTAGIDAGRQVFHKQTSLGLACASCHPEGREDGNVWDFNEVGKRRTQMLAGNILDRAPYHWNGDMSSLPVLMDDVFAIRMSGGQLTERQKRSLGPWLDRIPEPSPAYVAPLDTIERGKAIFESAGTGCIACHNGALLTNNKLVDVGTGGNFKVPSLIGIGARAPFMHDGCAKTLTDRFTVCGNNALHGQTSHLTPTEVQDLVAYLEAL